MPDSKGHATHLEETTRYHGRLRESYERGYVDRLLQNLPKLVPAVIEDSADRFVAIFTDPEYGVARVYLNGYVRAEQGLSNAVTDWREAGEPGDGPQLGIDDNY